MVGVAGGVVDGQDLETMVEATLGEEWYQVDRFEDRGRGLAHVHHGEKDPGGHDTWTGDRGVVTVHGAIGNRRFLDRTDDGLYEAILDRPSVVLPKLDGPFALAAYDRRDEEFLVATDKVGTRSCFYATEGGLLFATQVDAIQALLEEPTIDERTIQDLLTFGHAFGDRTLLAEVRAVPPASMLRYHDGEASVERYWEPEFGRLPVDGYVDRTLGVYRDAMANVTATIDGKTGLWLSGGLDSRTMTAVLEEQLGSFRTLTYDANPGGGANLEPARRVADLLDVENEVTPFEPGPFAEAIPRGIEITDGLVDWGFFVNLPFILDCLHDRVDVMLEAAPQGEYFGEDVWLYDLRHKPPVEAVFGLWGMNDPDLVERLLVDPVDPKRSIREELGNSTRSDPRHRTLDAIRRSFSYGHFRSKKLARSQVGTRLPWAHGAFQDHVAKLPDEAFRIRTVPFTGGKLPYGVSLLKLELVRRLDRGLDRVPYERTKFSPAWPLTVHAAGYSFAKGKELLADEPSQYARWYRDSRRMRRFVDGLLADASDRPFFDADAVADLREAVLSGESDSMRAVSAITTVECWLQNNYEGTRGWRRRRDNRLREDLGTS